MKWPHLVRIHDEIPALQNCEVGLLIGYNCPQALAPRDFICGEGNTPYAQRTHLGWSIVGVAYAEETDHDEYGISHRVICSTVPDDIKLVLPEVDIPNNVTYICRSTIKEEVNPHIHALLESDFSEKIYEENILSQNDVQFMKLLAEHTHQDAEGYYEMPLPFVSDNPCLPDNKRCAYKRLQYLKHRFKINADYLKDYKTFMDDIICRGDAELVQSVKHANKEPVWYLPHHGVYHKKKPGKICIVFDCSAKYEGTSLNEQLLKGPLLINSLVGVLLRFRMESIAFMCDVEKMFHKFRVSVKHRNYLRFFWWKDSDLTVEPSEYRMKVHFFGATSSPGCANYGLKRIANDHETKSNTNACQFIRDNFYVDDGLASTSTAEEAIHVIQDARKICRAGNLRLHKFTSNSKVVLQSIPSSERLHEETTMDLDFEDQPIERALGIQWCTLSDSFVYKLSLPDKPHTRRGVLSTVASIYDPLGCIAPFTLQGKLILQQMCRDDMGWDEELSGDLLLYWRTWLDDLNNLRDLKICRCYKPSSFGNVVKWEVHHFCDASFLGYGVCSYLRITNDADDVHCQLIFAKARVAPLRVVTMPRLELTAALLAVRISKMIVAELNISDVSEHFWTDSQVAFGYIQNSARRFHVYVANRVEQIRTHTEPDQWHYVNTDVNPADYASRGLTVKSLLTSTWFHGPKFLWKVGLPHVNEVNYLISPTDSEVKKIVAYATNGEECDLQTRFEKFSDWSRLVRAINLLQQYGRRLHKCKLKSDVDAIKYTEAIIVKQIQRRWFSTEMLLLMNNQTLKKGSNLYKLDAFLDTDNTLRVGGRLSRAAMDYGVKHPIILPKNAHITQLIIKHYHEKVHHQGRGITINEIRSNGWWIIGCTRLVASYIFKCVTCSRLRGQTSGQKMSDLPTFRLEESAPFTHIGMDCFGPFVTVDARKEKKRYGVVFTCLASRAVHIEVIDDMSTDTFINSLRCFVAIRGPVRSIVCDRGSNFIGASNELKRAAKEINYDLVKNTLSYENCDFFFNVPQSSHMGGVWERQIRTIRNILNAIMKQHSKRLNLASLRTFMYETMAIVNSLPIAVSTLGDSTQEPLTPNHLLTMKSKIALPLPGRFDADDIYSRKRWRIVQQLCNEFWIDGGKSTYVTYRQDKNGTRKDHQ